MLKLEKFKKESNRPDTKYMIYAAVIILIVFAAFIFYKSYAMYKIVETYDVIRSKIGEFDNEDLILKYTVNGEIINKSFPSKNSGYKFLSMTCENGVIASWDNDSWGIVNVNSENKNVNCTVNFEVENWNATKENSQIFDTHKGIVYLDPTNNMNECRADNSNSSTEVKEGCMKWYIYDEDEYSYKLILDHNTTARVSFGSDDNNIKSILNELVNTSNWKLRPRLITAEEIAKITNNKDIKFNDKSDWYYLNSNNKVPKSYNENIKDSYYWLYDNLSNCALEAGCKLEDNNIYNNYGSNESGNTNAYWTSTKIDDTNIWSVTNKGMLGLLDKNNINSYDYGVRPVIEIPKAGIQ